MEYTDNTRNSFLVDNPVKIEVLLARDIMGFYERFDGITAVKVISYLKTIGILRYDDIRQLFINATLEDHEIKNAKVSYMLYPDEYFTVM